MGKNILIAAATVKEIGPFLNWYRKGISGNDHEIDILISGIGLTATASNLTRQICFKRPQFIIQAGISGCFDRAFPLGSVVAVKQDCVADEGVIEAKQLKTVADLRMRPLNQFPYSGVWLVNSGIEMNKIKLKKVKAISVNQISTSRKIMQFYRDKFDPLVESMEGAALHYVCLMEKIPFLQIRSVSNYIGERNKKNWNMKDSIINLNIELEKLVSQLTT